MVYAWCTLRSCVLVPWHSGWVCIAVNDGHGYSMSLVCSWNEVGDVLCQVSSTWSTVTGMDGSQIKHVMLQWPQRRGFVVWFRGFGASAPIKPLLHAPRMPNADLHGTIHNKFGTLWWLANSCSENCRSYLRSSWNPSDLDPPPPNKNLKFFQNSLSVYFLGDSVYFGGNNVYFWVFLRSLGFLEFPFCFWGDCGTLWVGGLRRGFWKCLNHISEWPRTSPKIPEIPKRTNTAFTRTLSKSSRELLPSSPWRRFQH